MKSRIMIGIPLAALLISVIAFDGLYPIIVISLFSFAGTYEVSHASLKRAFRPFPVPAYLFSFFFPYVFYFAGEMAAFLLFLACYIASMILLVIRRPAEPANVLISFFLYIYPILNFVCVTLTANSFSKDSNCIAKILMMVVPLVSDMCPTLLEGRSESTNSRQQSARTRHGKARSAPSPEAFWRAS